MKINYFFSGWILNFGVVPLFLLAALRFLPIFFLRISRRTSVIFVFETMTQLLYRTVISIFYRIKYLSFSTLTVKAILASLIICPCAMSQEPDSTLPSQLFLGIGEHKEWPVQTVPRFSNGNREIVSLKYLSKERKILIKGIGQGFSEIILWPGTLKEHRLKIYVTTKLKKMALMNSLEAFQEMGLLAHPSGGHIQVSGELKKFSDYKRLKSILSDFKDELLIDIVPSKKLIQEILGQIYKQAFDQYLDEFYCRFEKIKLVCYFAETNPPQEIMRKEWESKYYISLIPIPQQRKNKNYRLKLKIIQMENAEGKEINWGLSQINGELGELFTIGLEGIAFRNHLILEQNQLELSTLAEPNLILQIGKEVKIDIGSDIPYPLRKEVQWHFAGLRLNLKIEMIGRSLQLNYQTELGRPTDSGAIASSRQASYAKIEIGKAIELYQIGFETMASNTDQLPYLSKIPVLGQMFTSQKNQKSFKKLSAIALLEEDHGNLK